MVLLKRIAGYLFLQSKVKYYVYKNYYHLFNKVIMSCRVEEVSPDRYIPLAGLKTEFLSVLKEAYQISATGDTFKDKDVLLLCQSLSEDKVMSLEEELNLYEKFVHRCNDLKLSVIIKPHPRSCAEKIEALSKLTSDQVMFFEDYGIPAESMLLSGKFKEVVGVYSNTLSMRMNFSGLKAFLY
ncbi:polysialyltransferase family glycosyltransferase [Pedobacter sp. NJ-S-72]